MRFLLSFLWLLLLAVSPLAAQTRTLDDFAAKESRANVETKLALILTNPEITPDLTQ